MLHDCIKSARDFADRILRYLHDGCTSIAETNLHMLRITTACGFAVSLLFYLISPYMVTNWAITPEYWMLMPVMSVFFVWSVFYLRRSVYNPKAVTLACALFNAALFATFIAISVFPYPATPELFVSVWLMTMPVLFIFTPAVDLILSIGASALYCILAAGRKTAAAIEYDTFAVLFAFIISRVIWCVLTHLQANSFFDKQRLINASRLDWLTGIMNKQAFEKRCAQLYGDEADRRGNAFAMLDVDDFKRINDQYGHEAGDRVLQCVSDCVKSSLAPNDLAGRVGGDEFALLIFNIGREEQLRSILNRVTENIAALSAEIVECGVSVSIGCLLLPTTPLDYRQIYKGADKLLYSVKQNGKNGVIIKRLAEVQNELERANE